MREIKFRAWDKQNKRMLSWKEIQTIEKDWSFRLVKVFSDKKYTLTQYTNLKDRNGNEIYEGDVVKTPIGTGMVFERLGCWFVEHLKELGYFPSHELEIVGNIYENPELVKEE